jgi:hypothetical protein
MKRSGAPIRKLLTACLLATALVCARPAEAQVLSGAVGGVAGVAAGGYVTLAVVVLQAQFGYYVHDVSDLFGWRSLPVLLGAGVGTGVGIWDSDRMVTGFVYGGGGAVLGGVVGYLVGPLIWQRPEGKWAGAAIGAGMGMAAGYFLGVLKPRDGIAPEWLGNSDKTLIPIVTLSVP